MSCGSTPLCCRRRFIGPSAACVALMPVLSRLDSSFASARCPRALERASHLIGSLRLAAPELRAGGAAKEESGNERRHVTSRRLARPLDCPPSERLTWMRARSPSQLARSLCLVALESRAKCDYFFCSQRGLAVASERTTDESRSLDKFQLTHRINFLCAICV